jgi:glycosyltransferase involved in cell wall biosynthesis
MNSKELTILMPCLNEAETIGKCIERAKKLLSESNIDGEILVADNGSADGSQEIARSLGARVVHCPIRGYGAAIMCGIENAEGKFILLGDSDDSYHFDEAFPMIEKLREGYDICMGTRLKGKIMPQAMPWLNRWIGNPILTAIGKFLFKVDLSDFHCGMRAFRRDKIIALNLVTTGMEWASEMVIKAKLAGLKITEVPITYYKAGRSHPPHLKRWRDGWRHLRFMLLHSPTWLFILPGFIMALIGLVGAIVLLPGMLKLGSVILDVHTLLVMAFLFLIGVQVIYLGLFAKLYSIIHGILPTDKRVTRFFRFFSLEKLLIFSILIGLLGLFLFSRTFWGWYKIGFSNLDYQITMRQLIPSLTLIMLSILSLFNGFIFSVLFLKTRPLEKEESLF